MATMRVLIGVFGALLLAVGLATIGLVEGPARLGGLWPVVVGSVVIIAVVLERTRYRSQADDHGFRTAGPGGGETERLEARFRPTQEIFVDPTTGHRMRVYLDAGTGERRYLAETEG